MARRASTTPRCCSASRRRPTSSPAWAWGAARCLLPAAEPARDALHALGRGGRGHREPGQPLPRSRAHGRHPQRRGHGGAGGAGAAGAARHLGEGRGPARARPTLRAVLRIGGLGLCPPWALDFDALLAQQPGDRLLGTPPTGEDVASYFHTGGTTGTPKLARRTHFNEAANAWSLATAARHGAAATRCCAACRCSIRTR